MDVNVLALKTDDLRRPSSTCTADEKEVAVNEVYSCSPQSRVYYIASRYMYIPRASLPPTLMIDRSVSSNISCS